MTKQATRRRHRRQEQRARRQQRTRDFAASLAPQAILLHRAQTNEARQEGSGLEPLLTKLRQEELERPVEYQNENYNGSTPHVSPQRRSNHYSQHETTTTTTRGVAPIIHPPRDESTENYYCLKRFAVPFFERLRDLVQQKSWWTAPLVLWLVIYPGSAGLTIGLGLAAITLLSALTDWATHYLSPTTTTTVTLQGVVRNYWDAALRQWHKFVHGQQRRRWLLVVGILLQVYKNHQGY